MNKAMTTSERNNLPQPPSLKNTIGPSFILLGLALGSGELILWPYLVSRWGLGLLWGGLLGITLQYFLNTEAMRYTLARGESVFVGFRKLSVIIPMWYIISTFIPWSIPGFSSASSQIFAQFLSINETVVAIALLITTGLILTFGKTLYKTMEIFQKTIIFLGLPLILVLVILLTKRTDWLSAAQGLVGRGDGWWFFPPGIGIFSFLGAFAYAGAGGNLNLAQSYYIKEKGFGMGKFTGKITSLFSKGAHEMQLEGDMFEDNKENEKKWKKWLHVVNMEHFMVFWLLGFLTILMLAVLSKSLVYGKNLDSGLSFLYGEAQVMQERIHPYVGTGFLILAAIMLFSTQTGVLESSTRIISENILLLFYKPGKKFNLSLAFYIALWSQIALGIIVYLLGFTEPRFLITLSAVLNGAAMMVSFPLIYILNKKRLRKNSHPSMLRKLVLMLGFLFFVSFVTLTVLENI